MNCLQSENREHHIDDSHYTHKSEIHQNTTPKSTLKVGKTFKKKNTPATFGDIEVFTRPPGPVNLNR